MKGRKATRQRAVIYARVSSKEQEAEGFSIDAQLRLLRTYAAQAGLVVSKEFVEAETAKRAGRKAFGEMLRFLAEHPGQAILIEKVDRLYRNFADYVKVDHLGVDLHFVKDSMLITDSSKSQDKFMHGIRVLMAKNYVDNLSEEIRKGLNEKADQGIYPTHAPLGYLNAFEPGTRRKAIVPDPARAHLVQQLFELYAGGLESIETLTKHARRIGLRSKKGAPLARSAIGQLLKHPAYCGLVRWNGKETAGVHEALVSPEIWQRCQDIMEGRHSRNTGYGQMPFAYRGVLRCKCGEIMSGELKKGRYVYYHCTGRKREVCGRPYVAETAITAAFATVLESLRVQDSELAWIRDGLAAADRDRHSKRDARETVIKTELGTLKSRLEALYVDKLSGEVSPEFYRETSQRWESRISDLQLEIAAIDRAECVTVDETMHVFELAASASSRFKIADPGQKRELVSFMCSNCFWRDGSLEARAARDLRFDAKHAQIRADRRRAGWRERPCFRQK